MSRQSKRGIDYFPVDVVFDEEIQLIDARFGVAGIGLLIKLWQIIYRNGYFIMWTEKEKLLYKTRLNADIILINDVINECVKWGIFNEKLFKKYNILTSNGIQKRYIEATIRRNEITIIKEYWLVKISDVYRNKVNVNINRLNDNKSTQKRREEKEKESKGEENKEKFAENILLTKEEHQNLVEKYGSSLTTLFIEELDNYKGAHGKKYKSDYRAILSWVVDKVTKAHPEKKPKEIIDCCPTEDFIMVEKEVTINGRKFIKNVRQEIPEAQSGNK